MPRKSISGFAEAGAAMAQQLDDNDLLNLFSAVGRVVSKRFLMKRPCLNSWQLVLDYLKSAMGFEPREQFRDLTSNWLKKKEDPCRRHGDKFVESFASQLGKRAADFLRQWHSG